MRQGTKQIFSIALCVALSLFFAACKGKEKTVTQIVPSKAKPIGKRVYGPIEPVLLNLTQEMKTTLGGTDIDGKPIEKAYVYFKSFCLVVYRDKFDINEYMDSISNAFRLMAQIDEFSREADVWAIQMQKKGSSDFVNMAVAPDQARELLKTGDIQKFIVAVDYLMISDRIIPPEERLQYYQGKIIPLGPQGFTPSP